ncbi:MAG: AI-2E family transporter [Armatimonadota bacterium]|nr:AI-2E family transporter [Armatimonadota bacterium]
MNCRCAVVSGNPFPDTNLLGEGLLAPHMSRPKVSDIGETPDKMPSNNWGKMIGYAVLAAFTVLLAYVAILAFAPGILHFLQALKGALPPFIISIVLALLLDPLVTRLQKRGMSRALAAAVVFIAFALVLAGGIIYLIPKVVSEVTDFANDLPGYYDNASKFVSDLAARAKPILMRFRIPTTVSEVIDRYSGEFKSAGQQAGYILKIAVRGILAKTIWLVWGVLIILLTFLLLKDMDKIRAKIVYLLPDRYRDKAIRTTGAVGAVFSRYLQGLIVVCAIYGFAATILFSAFGVRYSLLIGLIAGLLYAVPYIGPIVTMLIVFLVSLLQNPSAVYMSFIVAGSTLVLNQIFDMFLTPKILGGAVGLHPALSIFALMFGGAAYGITGMILAVPVAASVQIILCEFFPKLREPLSKFDTVPKAKSSKPRGRRRGREGRHSK